MKVAVYDKAGKKMQTSVETKLFAGKVNRALLGEAVYIYSSNRRQPSAKTKDRSEVSGGGVKPWRQKGTGRARAGSNRSPIWRGGGVTFGPTGEENYKRIMTQKKRKKALLAALAAKKAEDVAVIKDMKLEKPSTQAWVKLLEALGTRRNVLIVTEQNDENLLKSVRNIGFGVNVHNWQSLNAYEILRADKLIFLGDSLSLVNKLVS